MKVHPLHPRAALLLESSAGDRYIAVSDLHVGLESDLGAKGITLEQEMVHEMVRELSGLVESEQAKGLILLGDIKHSIGAISKQEWNDIPLLLKKLSSNTQVYLVPGNHDGNIRHLIPQNVDMISSLGMTLEETLLIHGHSMPSDLRVNVKRIVMGHLHPVFLKQGSLLNGERIWIYLQVKKESLFSERGSLDIVILPSFNPYLYATSSQPYHKSISPITTRILQYSNGVEKCVIARLDGSIIGDEAMLPNVL